MSAQMRPSDCDPKARFRNAKRHSDFTIDQNPYLQGFLPTLYLYLYNLSGGLLSPPNTDTGLTFVTKDTVSAYQVSSRFEGSTTAQKVIPRSGAINNPQATTSV